MSTVWLGLGSNVGNRADILDRAVGALGGVLSELSVAPYYESAPRDFLEQNDFLNTAVRGRTVLSPGELLDAILIIEKEGGRIRSTLAPKGPRTIDIDILLFDDGVLDDQTAGTGGLIIPHPEMAKRLFVLKPLLDLNEDLKDPTDGIPWADKASNLREQRVKLYRT